MEIIDADIAKIQEERRNKEEIASLTTVTYDVNLYGIGNKFEGYEHSFPLNEDEEDQDARERKVTRKLASYMAPESVWKDLPRLMGGNNEDMGFKKPQNIIDREDDYSIRSLTTMRSASWSSRSGS